MDINYEELERELKGHELGLKKAKENADFDAKRHADTIKRIKQIIKDKKDLLKMRPQGSDPIWTE